MSTPPGEQTPTSAEPESSAVIPSAEADHAQHPESSITVPEALPPSSSDATAVAKPELAPLTIGTPQVPATSSMTAIATASETEAQAMVIASLRSQVQDLFSQVTQLNGKLVQSYDRVSDLEDNLHVASAGARTSSLKISQLELERTQHLSALNTGLLVEKAHVTSELTRLMEKATDEAARRGKAENAREEIEQELDDLSAGLFGQANNMVAQARIAQAISERKVEEAERALKTTEEAVAVMQQQMQQMQSEKEKADETVERMKIRMGKGKWVDTVDSTSSRSVTVRLLSSHAPYEEFLLFVAHLRAIRPASQQPPAMSTLLPLPFLARLQNEDSDPTIRLDLAPSLNWLSRRSVLAAIHSSELSIEPMSSTSLLQELSASSSSMIPGTNQSIHNISCALCGTSIVAPELSQKGRPSLFQSRHPSTNNSWSTSLFKLPLPNGISPAPSPGPTKQSATQTMPSQVYIFRITTLGGTAPSTPQSPSNLAHAQSQPPARSSTVYPLCASGWCLTRLRSTCSLWAFVRTAVVEHVWEEEVPSVIHAPVPKRAAGSRDGGGVAALAEKVTALAEKVTAAPAPAPAPASTPTPKPPLPPRRSKIGGFWGMASSALERVSSRTASGSEGAEAEKKVPTPHIVHAPPPRSPARAAKSPIAGSNSPPPPVPKRSGSRKEVPTLESLSPSDDGPIAPAGDAPAAAGADAPATNGVGAPTANGADVPATNVVNGGSPKQGDEASGTSSPAFLTPTEGTTPENGSPKQSGEFESEAAKPTEPTVEDVPATAVNGTVSEAAPAPADVATPSSPPADASATTTPEAAQTPTKTAPPPLPARASPGSRTSSPAHGAPPPVPPRRGSPAAPPIPRRAPARRPVSLVAQATADGVVTTDPAPSGETPSSPAPTAEVPILSPAPTAATDVADGSATEPSTPRPRPQQIEEDRSSTPAATQLPTPEEEKSEESNGVIAPAVPTTTVAATVLSEEKGKVSSSPVPMTNGAPAPERSSEESVSDAASGVYVGEATWEERTWKALVSLREEMFWARVGGVR